MWKIIIQHYYVWDHLKRLSTTGTNVSFSTEVNQQVIKFLRVDTTRLRVSDKEVGRQNLIKI